MLEKIVIQIQVGEVVNINHLKRRHPPWRWYFLVQLRKISPPSIEARVLKWHHLVGALVRAPEKSAHLLIALMLQSNAPLIIVKRQGGHLALAEQPRPPVLLCGVSEYAFLVVSGDFVKQCSL